MSAIAAPPPHQQQQQQQQSQHQQPHSPTAAAAAGGLLPTQGSGPNGGLPSVASLGRTGSVTLPINEHDVEAVRAMVPEDLRHLADDATVHRFIRATNGKLAESGKRLSATLKWRQETKPEHVVCHACVRNPKSHYMHVVGYDLQHRPIIYSCLALAGNKVYKDNMDHMIQTFETAIKCMPPGVEQWVWACDFHGFGMADVSPKLAKAFLNISAEHYPERLGLFLILDAPSLFGMLWRAIQSFVDPKTYTKIRFVPFDPAAPKSQLRSTLAQLCDASTAEWILTEMAENRDHKKLPQKTYSMTHIHSSASKGDLTPLPEGQHDVRGSRALLQHYLSAPDVLEPQATARPH